MFLSAYLLMAMAVALGYRGLIPLILLGLFRSIHSSGYPCRCLSFLSVVACAFVHSCHRARKINSSARSGLNDLTGPKACAEGRRSKRGAHGRLRDQLMLRSAYAVDHISESDVPRAANSFVAWSTRSSGAMELFRTDEPFEPSTKRLATDGLPVAEGWASR